MKRFTAAAASLVALLLLVSLAVVAPTSADEVNAGAATQEAGRVRGALRVAVGAAMRDVGKTSKVPKKPAIPPTSSPTFAGYGNTFTLLGSGYCEAGFIVGWNGTWSVESCQAKCIEYNLPPSDANSFATPMMQTCYAFEQCEYVSVKEGEGGRCTLYNWATSCDQRITYTGWAEAHVSYQRENGFNFYLQPIADGVCNGTPLPGSPGQGNFSPTDCLGLCAQTAGCSYASVVTGSVEDWYPGQCYLYAICETLTYVSLPQMRPVVGTGLSRFPACRSPMSMRL